MEFNNFVSFLISLGVLGVAASVGFEAWIAKGGVNRALGLSFSKLTYLSSQSHVLNFLLYDMVSVSLLVMCNLRSLIGPTWATSTSGFHLIMCNNPVITQNFL